MPNYEFTCEECGKVMETGIIKYEERPDVLACECGGAAKYTVSSRVNNTFPQGRSKGGYFRPEVGGRRHQKFY